MYVFRKACATTYMFPPFKSSFSSALAFSFCLIASAHIHSIVHSILLCTLIIYIYNIPGVVFILTVA